MYIVHKRGEDRLSFIFRERKFENKLKALVDYDGKRPYSIYYKRKDVPVRILAFFRYRNRNPLNKKEWIYFETAQWLDNHPFTWENMLTPITEYAEDMHMSFQLMGSDAVQLREITLLYIYKNKESSEAGWESPKPKRKR